MEEVCVNVIDISNDIESFNNKETVKYIPSNDTQELTEKELTLYNYIVNTYTKNIDK